MNPLNLMNDRQLYLAIRDAKQLNLDLEFITYLTKEAKRRIESHKRTEELENLEILLLMKVI